MNRIEHITIGAIVDVLTLLGRKASRNEQVTIGEIFEAALVGGSTAYLPDFIEPANGPDHRGIAHSTTTGLALASAAKTIHERQDIPEKVKDRLIGCIAAYESHLFLDSLTPAGLPFFTE